MPINRQYLIVYDYETGGRDPLVHEPIQVAAVVLDPKTLSLVPNAEFNSMMKPPGDEKDWKIEEEALKINKKTREQIREAPPRKQVHQSFCNFVDKYKKGNWGPIGAGFNVRNFDSKIIDRLNQEIGRKTPLFSDYRQVDFLDISFYQFGSTNDLPKETLDTYRAFFGIPKENAHDALQDVKDTAKILARFMLWYRKLYSEDKFRNCFVEKEEDATST